MVKLYKKFKKDKYKFEKPIVALFSPINLLKLIRQMQKEYLNKFDNELLNIIKLLLEML